MDEEEWIEKSNSVDSCESCNSNDISGETHTCPFREEISNDYEFECNCCEDCTNDCTMSI